MIVETWYRKCSMSLLYFCLHPALSHSPGRHCPAVEEIDKEEYDAIDP